MPYPRFRVNMTLSELGTSLKSIFLGREGDSPEAFSLALKEFGQFLNVVLVGSGRTGFRLLLESLDFKPSSEIIFPAYTFHPIPLVTMECGLKPVFADVDEQTWNIDPEKIVPLINERTKAIMPTHLFGVPADMEAIDKIARSHGLFVIEDCAHALGATYRDKLVGNFGDAALFTFAMSKNLPCWGGGAMILKDRDLGIKMMERIAEGEAPSGCTVLKRQRSNVAALLFTQPMLFPWTLYPALRIADLSGSDYFDRPFLEEVGASAPVSKSRIQSISPFQAASGLRQLARFPRWLEKQTANARLLRDRLADCPGIELQQEPPGTRSSFLYVRARVDNPTRVRHILLNHGVDTKPDDMRNCAALNIFGKQSPCPEAARLGGQCIEIPCSQFYSEHRISRLADRILAASFRF